jgi:hypothetical protein
MYVQIEIEFQEELLGEHMCCKLDCSTSETFYTTRSSFRDNQTGSKD